MSHASSPLRLRSKNRETHGLGKQEQKGGKGRPYEWISKALTLKNMKADFNKNGILSLDYGAAREAMRPSVGCKVDDNKDLENGNTLCRLSANTSKAPLLSK